MARITRKQASKLLSYCSVTRCNKDNFLESILNAYHKCEADFDSIKFDMLFDNIEKFREKIHVIEGIDGFPYLDIDWGEKIVNIISNNHSERAVFRMFDEICEYYTTRPEKLNPSNFDAKALAKHIKNRQNYATNNKKRREINYVY